MPVFDTYYASKAGPTGSLAFLALSATAPLKVLNTITGPTMIMLRSDVDVYLRQGDSTVTATTSDFLLTADIYFPMLIESLADVYIWAIGSTTIGTLFMTTSSDLSTVPNSA
jgi:hypothetical protein